MPDGASLSTNTIIGRPIREVNPLAKEKGALYVNVMARQESLIRAQKAYEEKTSKLNVRLKPEERERLDELADKAGVTPTALIKMWIRKGKP